MKKDRYLNILAIGVEYENKFSEETKDRLDNNLDKCEILKFIFKNYINMNQNISQQVHHPILDNNTN